MNQTEPRLVKWPFFLGDAVLVGLSYLIFAHHKSPMTPWEMAFFTASGALGAVLGVLPFLLEYRALVNLTSTQSLAEAVAQIQKLDLVAGQISAATSQWQMVQEQSTKTAGAAREIAERMTAEANAFGEFLQKANDGEKANLRLELEKLRRGEGEWLQIIVRLLDHTFALNQAAKRSGQPALIEQLGNFQNACRDVARRVGLVAFVPAPADIFDPQCHQLADPQTQPPAGAQVGETVAPGYTFQGQLLRPALVALQPEAEIVEAPLVLKETETMLLEVDGKSASPALEEPNLL
jgi:molecular chaperone GrpE (heat shock protein)